MSPRKPKTAEKRRNARESLSYAQGEFHDGRTFLAIAVRVMDRIDDSPRDPGLRARVAPSEVTLVLGLALKRLEAGISLLDEGLTHAF